MGHRVFVDANVLVSKTLMDWLFLLRTHNEGMYSVVATEDILAEVLHSLRKKSPQAPGHVTSRRAELIRANLDEIVVDFPADLTFTGSDADDYHVHAGAIVSEADFVLSGNKPADFTADESIEPYEIITPDEFFMLAVDSAPLSLRPVIEKQVQYWRTHPSHRQLDDALSRAGCVQFSARVRQELMRLAQCG